MQLSSYQLVCYALLMSHPTDHEQGVTSRNFTRQHSRVIYARRLISHVSLAPEGSAQLMTLARSSGGYLDAADIAPSKETEKRPGPTKLMGQAKADLLMSSEKWPGTVSEPPRPRQGISTTLIQAVC